MRLLILGGTAWLGREFAVQAASQGAHVTCAARGISGTAPENCAFVALDRDDPEGLRALAGTWDVMVDVSRNPRHVARATEALVPHVQRCVFISTGSVYADPSVVGADEAADLLEAWPDDTDPGESPEAYGAAKVRCEQLVVDAFGVERALVVRAGLIGGPGDESGRTTYWPWRFARSRGLGRPVLVPDAFRDASQVIDARDLVAWALDAASRGVGGTFNAVGDAADLADHWAVAQEAAGAASVLRPAQGKWLREHGVEPWMGDRSLPLWIGDPAWGGFSRRSNDRAKAAGLRLRPLVETLRDGLAWELSGLRRGPRRAGLTDADEAELLALLD
jgi:nucleoside-diphosphate-sugar epimerase